MILTCPTCATRYRVDPAKLGSHGRTVRCNACGNSWHARPVEERLRQDPIPAGLGPRSAEPAAYARVSAPVRARSRGALAWFLVVMALSFLVGAGYVERARVVEAWPPALKLYRMMGLIKPAAGEGLAVRNVTTRRNAENGVQFLTVEGEVVNLSDEPRAVPMLTAILTDAQHRDVQHWSFHINEPKLLPGERAPFVSHVQNPAAAATSLTVAFLSAPE